MAETITVILIVGSALLIPWFVAHQVARNQKTMLTIVLWVMWGTVAGLLYSATRQTPGLDGIGYAIALVLCVAPSGFGLIGGEVTGRYVRSESAR